MMSDIEILTQTLSVEGTIRTALITNSDCKRERSYEEESSTIIFSRSSSISCWFLAILQVLDGMR
jgi:hypothetical protein